MTGGGWVLRSGRGQVRETRSTSAAPPTISRPTFPRQHWPKDLSILQRDIHPIEIKYCEDVRTLDRRISQRRAGTAQRLLLHPSRSSVTLHTILLGVGGTIYNNHTLEPFKELGLDPLRANKLAFKRHSVNYAAKLFHTKRKLSSTIIIRRRFQVKPATLPILIDFWHCFLPAVLEDFMVPDTKSAWLLFLK